MWDVVYVRVLVCESGTGCWDGGHPGCGRREDGHHHRQLSVERPLRVVGRVVGRQQVPGRDQCVDGGHREYEVEVPREPVTRYDEP